MCPICQSTSACSIWATCLGMARRRRRLECLPVACQNPEPRERLVLLSGLDDCHDCHFCTQRVSLHGDAPSVPAKRAKEWELYFIQFTNFICAMDILCYKLYKRTSTGRHTSAIPYNTTMSPSPPMLTSNNVIQFFLNHHVIYHSFRPCSPFNLHLYSLYKGTNFSQLKSTFMPSL